MCKASQEAKNTIDAKAGQTLGVGVAAGGLAALHPMGKTATDCVACVQTGTTLTLQNIPHALQDKFGIGAVEQVTFEQTGHNIQDQVVTSNGAKISLRDLSGKGVTVYVGVIQAKDTKGAVDAIMSDAVAGAAAATREPAAQRELVDAGR